MIYFMHRISIHLHFITFFSTLQLKTDYTIRTHSNISAQSTTYSLHIHSLLYDYIYVDWMKKKDRKKRKYNSNNNNSNNPASNLCDYFGISAMALLCVQTVQDRSREKHTVLCVLYYCYCCWCFCCGSLHSCASGCCCLCSYIDMVVYILCCVYRVLNGVRIRLYAWYQIFQCHISKLGSLRWMQTERKSKKELNKKKHWQSVDVCMFSSLLVDDCCCCCCFLFTFGLLDRHCARWLHSQLTRTYRI